MDLAFLLRAERMLARQAASAIDHRVLVAALAAHQAASATARAARRRSDGGWERPNAALAELLAGGPAWREARRVQRGSFHSGAAERSAKEA